MSYIFIHGLGQQSSSWNQTISFMNLTDPWFSLDLMALLGHREATYSNLYQAFKEDCLSCPGELHLCGLSLGAVLALNFAIDHPEDVQSLVLIGGQYQMPKTLLKIQSVLFRLMPQRSFVKMGFKKEEFLRLTSTMSDLDFSAECGKIACPALIVCGEKDSANQRAAREMAKMFPCAEMTIIKNARHEVNIDAPKALAEALYDFYDGFKQSNE